MVDNRNLLLQLKAKKLTGQISLDEYNLAVQYAEEAAAKATQPRKSFGTLIKEDKEKYLAKPGVWGVWSWSWKIGLIVAILAWIGTHLTP